MTQRQRKRKRRTRVWIFLIRKGGSAKTLSAVNFAAALTTLGRKVLLIDVDPQGDASTHCGVKAGKDDLNLNSLFTEVGLDPRSCVRQMSFTFERKHYTMDVLPSSKELDDTDLSMKATQAGMFVPIIQALATNYTDIVLDTRPTRSLLTLSAMMTATHAIIPMEAGVFALDQLTDTLLDIAQVQTGLNPGLKLVGILPTRVKEATNLSRAILGDAANGHDEKLIRYQDGAEQPERLLLIHDSVALAEAPAYGIPGIAYARSCEGARDYLKMAEVLDASET